jgi:hypothetical protein
LVINCGDYGGEEELSSCAGNYVSCPELVSLQGIKECTENSREVSVLGTEKIVV